MQQSQEQDDFQVMKYFFRFYAFLRQRDAKIVELFFLALNIWILTVFVIPVHALNGSILTFLYALLPQVICVSGQTIIVCLNLVALIYDKKLIRIISAHINLLIMLAFSTGFALMRNPNTGTYALLGLLAAFVSWKVQLLQE